LLQEHVDVDDYDEDLEEMEEAWTVPDVTLPDLRNREIDVGSSTAHQQEEVLPIPAVNEAKTVVSSDTTNAPTARDEVITNASENPTQVSLFCATVLSMFARCTGCTFLHKTKFLSESCLGDLMLYVAICCVKSSLPYIPG
jgi:hypothetical protein